MTAALLLAGAVYAGLGLALPLSLGARGVLLISLNVIGVLLAWVLTLAWLFPLTQAVHRRHLVEWTTHLRLLSATEFEWLVGELLRREGRHVEETGGEGAPNGNVDLRIRRGDRQMIVQCKRWASKPVGVSEVRELAGTVAREQLPRGAGMLVTLSHFTGHAITEAAQLELELVDNRHLCARLERAGGRDRPGSPDRAHAGGAPVPEVLNADGARPLAPRLVAPLPPLPRTGLQGQASPQSRSGSGARAAAHLSVHRRRPQTTQPATRSVNGSEGDRRAAELRPVWNCQAPSMRGRPRAVKSRWTTLNHAPSAPPQT